MLFSLICSYFDRIDATSSRTQITELLAELLEKASAQQAEIIVNISMGMLRASYNPTLFNFAQKSILLVMHQFSKEHNVEQLFSEYGDVGLVAYTIAQYHRAHDKQLSLEYVYERLLVIEAINGSGSQEQKAEVLLELLYSLDPLGAKFVVRIVAGILRLGFSDMTILDALSWMYQKDKKIKTLLEQAYNKCSNLGFIANTLKSQGLEAITSISITLGMPIRLAAAERMHEPQEIIDKLGECIAQPKLDGMRVQAHVQNTDSGVCITLFSRNLLTITDMFPEIVQALSCYQAKNLIIEGEAIAYDPVNGNLLSFQQTAKRKRKYAVEDTAQALPVTLYAFDILYADNESVFEWPYVQRRTLLKKLVAQLASDSIACIEEFSIKNAQELEDCFLAMTRLGFEGLMVKKNDASYQAGKRNFNWIKLKRLEKSRMSDTIDAVILGYYQGGGKRATFGVGAFLAGIYNSHQDCFQTIAKVGTGLSDKEWQSLYTACSTLRVDQKPKNVECASELYPFVWLNPSIVCLLQADEITLSPLHTANKTTNNQGFALRFPRFMGYVTDKTPEQTTSTDELRTMFKQQLIIK